MSKLIVPPPMLLASRIAWRNEPVPLSLVFETVKTRGDVTPFTRAGASCAIWPSCFLVLRTRVARVERVDLNALEKLEATKIEAIDSKATGRLIRSAKADREMFLLFFILFFGVRFGY